MDNPELILQSLEHFPKLKEEEDYSIPVELEEYIHYVAKTGDPVFQWPLVKPLFREKMIKVVTDFFESNPGEIPDYPNVNKFNYDSMKSTLLERIDWFKGAPFTIQRISELLVNPTKEYNRVDKYMRALEKNIYVVSTREPGMPQPVEENNSSLSFILNGNDFDLKSDNEVLASKEDEEEDSNTAALLLLKKCSNGDSEEANFNIEVDVTNTTPLEDTQDDKVEAEINVHDECQETGDDTLNISEGKCGQTRKHEDEDDTVENDPKRFKMDSSENNDDDNKEESGVVIKDVSEEDMNIEEQSQESEAVIECENNLIITCSEESTESKVDVEMELEDPVDNKIESFDNDKHEQCSTSLNTSENDSMVVSQESESSLEENVEKNFEDHVDVDAVVSESSDMDLSDGITSSVDLKTNEISDLLDLPQSDKDNSSIEKLNDLDTDSSKILLEEIVSVENVTPSNETVQSDTNPPNNEEGSFASTDKEPEFGDAASEPAPEDHLIENIPNEDASASTVCTDQVVESSVSTETVSLEISEVEEDLNIPAEECVLESVSEVQPEIEEAILEEDEFENADSEEAGSNIDPLSTEAESTVEGVDSIAVEDKPVSDESENVVAEMEEAEPSLEQQ